MTKRMIIIALICLIGITAAEAKQPNLYKITVKDAQGQTVSMKQYKGRVLLIVNTATRCGFTPQYTELEKFHEDYHNQGLEILDFPCNQFGQQAPGTIGEITQFCTATYGTQFPQFDKVDVNGSEASPLFTFLKSQQPFHGFGQSQRGQFMHNMMEKQDPDYDKNPDIKWNFTKFLVDRKGRVVARFEPTDDMETVKQAIEKLL